MNSDEIPRIVRFIQSLLNGSLLNGNKSIKGIPKIPQFINEYEKNQFMLRFLLDKLNPNEQNEEWKRIYDTITHSDTSENINKAIKYLSGNISSHLILFKDKCKIFTCIPDQIYYISFLVTLMKYKPINNMPNIYKYLTFPSINQTTLSKTHLESIQYIINDIILPHRNDIIKIDQIDKFKDLIPDYDQGNVTQLFILMQLPMNYFCASMRHLNYPIYIESYHLYHNEDIWKNSIKIKDITFIELAKNITTI
jgi:hypothetical protein